jgi:DNA-binding response OmpR family regulator
MPTNGGTSASPGGSPADRLVIFDDDICFGALITAKARSQGFDSRFFTSLVDMGSFARIKDFDIAIIDFYLGTIRGDEIAEYVDTFFDQIPVIIVSSQDMSESRISRWPASVRMFIPKSEGPGRIIGAAQHILQRERMLKRFAGQATPGGTAGRSL